jgi:hypothetical protein
MVRLPVLKFGADGSVTQSEPLVAGGQVLVHYERARLAGQEQLDQGGEHTWVLSGFCSLNGGTPQVFQLGGRSSDDVAEQVLGLSQAGTIELWFERNDLYGAHRFDSNDGYNFRFEVLPQEGCAEIRGNVPIQVSGPPAEAPVAGDRPGRHGSR